MRAACINRWRRVFETAAWIVVTAVAMRVAAAPPLFTELRTEATATIDLEEGWRNPPRSARTRAWWWWLNGNVDKEAITRDLEQMQAKGLGGANIIDAGGAEQRGNDQVPHGPDFGSPAWRKLFVHALREAERLDLELGFNITSGWNLGGPLIPPRYAAKKLTFAELEIEGGKRVQRQLPSPPRVADYYRDVKTFALRLPSEEGRRLARIDDWKAKAYYDYPGGFIATDASRLLQFKALADDERATSSADVVDLEDVVNDTGELDWEPPEGRWLIVRLGFTLSGARVSTHSEGWEGWAVDYLDRHAFDFYWDQVVTPILDDARPYLGRSLRYLHTDSWELGPVNWTPKMASEFARLRGYSMADYFPALAGYVVGSPAETNRFLNDFRRTLSDLIIRNKYEAFADAAHSRGLGVHPESAGPHAVPIDAIQCLGVNDIPMGEFWARSRTHRVHDHERFFIKQPSSAAHVHGRRIVLAEAFT
ncbi:MAG: hypothetical protein KDA61_01430, partial [Planctomycetales bacterium]|nr:hypothetical protein [Planctomycetales bacterium]